MKKILAVICLIYISTSISGQSFNERKHINGGIDLWDNFVKEMFQYETFTNGTVVYKNGQRFERPLNYNRILETVQFIDQKGDTLAIANEQAIEHIIIGTDEFSYRPTCVQLITPDKSLKIYKHEKLRIADIRRKGALGVPNTSGSIESINQVFTWMSSYQLDVNELLLLSKNTSFFIEAKGKMVPASRKNILDQFKQNREVIDEYVSAEKINFSNERELIKLADYISKL